VSLIGRGCFPVCKTIDQYPENHRGSVSSTRAVAGKKVVAPITKGAQGVQKRRMLVGSVGKKKKWIMQGIEDAGHDGNSEILSWFFPSLASSSLPLCLSSFNSLDSRERDIKGQENGGSACDMYGSCVRWPYDVSFLMDYLFRALLSPRNWSGKRAFIASSDEIRFRVESPTSILKRSINLDIDGFDGSLCIGIPLRGNAVRVYWNKLITNRYSVILILIPVFVFRYARVYVYACVFG